MEYMSGEDGRYYRGWGDDKGGSRKSLGEVLSGNRMIKCWLLLVFVGSLSYKTTGMSQMECLNFFLVGTL